MERTRRPWLLAATVITAACAPGNTPPETAPRADVSAGDLQRNADEPIEKTLQRKVPGLIITRTSDGSIALQIRGAVTYDTKDGNIASAAPLYVVDDMPIAPGPGGSLPGLDPYAIESIRVLKGAEAGIYGIQGANGVIVIKTKTGRARKP